MTLQYATREEHPRARELQNHLDAAYNSACPVYLAAWGDEFVKIGYSCNVYRRIKTIQSTCPVPVRLLGWVNGGPAVETELHHRFADSRHRGEWYRLTESIREFVENECNRGPAPVIKHFSYRYNLRDFETVERLITRLSSPTVDASYPQASAVGVSSSGRDGARKVGGDFDQRARTTAFADNPPGTLSAPNPNRDRHYSPGFVPPG